MFRARGSYHGMAWRNSRIKLLSTGHVGSEQVGSLDANIKVAASKKEIFLILKQRLEVSERMDSLRHEKQHSQNFFRHVELFNVALERLFAVHGADSMISLFTRMQEQNSLKRLPQFGSNDTRYDIFAGLRGCPQPNSWSYTVVIRRLVQEDRCEEAIEKWDALLASGCRPSQVASF
jgi:pentatricopeptide repeat protein